MANWTAKQKLAVWNKAKTVRGKDPKVHRKDPYGNLLYWDSYGRASDMGWDIDHIKPKERGGSDATVNLQVLKASLNRSKGASLIKKSRHSK